MQFLQYFFWLSIAIVFYTYIGYGIILFILVRIKEKIHPPSPLKIREPLPDVTLFIAAYNEEKIVEEKMENCHNLNYPKEKLHIVWVTDGTTAVSYTHLTLPTNSLV